jgi:hypothetical protein
MLHIHGGSLLWHKVDLRICHSRGAARRDRPPYQSLGLRPPRHQRRARAQPLARLQRVRPEIAASPVGCLCSRMLTRRRPRAGRPLRQYRSFQACCLGATASWAPTSGDRARASRRAAGLAARSRPAWAPPGGGRLCRRRHPVAAWRARRLDTRHLARMCVRTAYSCDQSRFTWPVSRRFACPPRR